MIHVLQAAAATAAVLMVVGFVTLIAVAMWQSPPGSHRPLMFGRPLIALLVAGLAGGGASWLLTLA